jgi:hypothetical protein
MRLPKVLFTGTPPRALPIPGVGAGSATTAGVREAPDMSIDPVKNSVIQLLTSLLARLGER